MNLRPPALLLSLLLPLLLAACASTGSGDDTRTGAALPVMDQALASQIPPGGAKILYDKSLIIGSGDNWMGRVVVDLSQGQAGAYNYFLEEYPKQGWTLVSAVRGKNGLLVFTKGERTATVEVGEGSGIGSGSGIVLTVSPKGSGMQGGIKRP